PRASPWADRTTPLGSKSQTVFRPVRPVLSAQAGGLGALRFAWSQPPSEFEHEFFALVAALDGDFEPGADAGLGESPGEVLGIVDAGVLDGLDLVAGLEAGLFRRAAGQHLADDDPV